MEWLYVVFLFLFFGFIFFNDLRNRKVLNLAISIALLVFFVLWVMDFFWVRQNFLPDFISSAIGLIAGLICFYPLWLKKVMGAGDVKFIAVLGCLLGWQPAAWVVLLSGFLTFPHALLQVLQVRRDGPHKKIERRGVPYAGYIALTAIIWLIWKLLK
ncbi:MAG: hypothetical protein KER_00501 [Kerstersia gyiorum]|uniref:A24 family peptidase n=1 Tax=Kerstersia gyiorum TaxID=206506 RepID=UPI0030CD49F0